MANRRHVEMICTLVRLCAHPQDWTTLLNIRSMAQLSDDCFAFGGPMLPVGDVLALIEARITPVAEV